MTILQNFRAYLQTESYSVYDIFDKTENITQLHCRAHARRMFSEAMDNDQPGAENTLVEIQKLYMIERIIKEQNLPLCRSKSFLCNEVRFNTSCTGQRMLNEYTRITPKSAIGKALVGSIDYRIKLSGYTMGGWLNIDNNPVENSLWPVFVDRKNYFFAGSHDSRQKKWHAL